MKTLRATTVVCLLFFALSPLAARAADISPEQVRTLTEEATIWGYPIVQNYKGTYFTSVLKQSPLYVGWNTLHHDRRLYTPENKIVVSPNNDTPYSSFILDLRAEPLVLSVPRRSGSVVRCRPDNTIVDPATAVATSRVWAVFPIQQRRSAKGPAGAATARASSPPR